MIRKIKLSRRVTSKRNLILILNILMVILIIGFVSAQGCCPSGSEQECPPGSECPPGLQGVPGLEGFEGIKAAEKGPYDKTAKPDDEEPIDVSEHFKQESWEGDLKAELKASSTGEGAMVSSMEEGRRTKVESIGDFQLVIKDWRGERVFTGFKQGEKHVLEFDENNELTIGTEVTAGKQTKIQYGFQKFTLEKDDKFSITEETIGEQKEKKAKIIPKEKISQPEQAELPDEFSPPETFEIDDYETIVEYEIPEDRNIKFTDDHDNEILVKGNLFYKGNTDEGGFYHKKGTDLNFGGVEFQGVENQGEWMRIITNAKNGVPENFQGQFAIFDQKNKVLGVFTNTPEASAVLNVPEENPFVDLRMKDEFLRFLALQATGEGESSGIFLIKDIEENVPKLRMIGLGAKADVDDKHLSIEINPRTGKPDLLLNIKNAKLNPGKGFRTLTFPMKIEFVKDDGSVPFFKDTEETPLAEHNLDLWVNGFRQFATLPKDVNWQEEQLLYKTQGSFSISPRLEYNYLHPDQQRVLNQIIEEKSTTLEKFLQLPPGKQQEMLEAFKTPEHLQRNQEQQEQPPRGQPQPEPGEKVPQQEPGTPDSSLLKNSIIGNLPPRSGTGTPRTIYDDILNHNEADRKEYSYSDGGDPTTIHEGQHEANDRATTTAREQLKAKEYEYYGYVDAFYIGNNQYLAILEPGVLKSQAYHSLPSQLQGQWAKFYMINQGPGIAQIGGVVGPPDEWGPNSNYMHDEWTAAITTIEGTSELIDKGLTRNIKGESLTEITEFTMNSLGVASHVKKHKSEYWEKHPEYGEFMAYNLIRAKQAYDRVTSNQRYSRYFFENQKTLSYWNFLARDTRDPRTERMREVVREVLGDSKSKEIFGF
jgi:hypothetical protein